MKNFQKLVLLALLPMSFLVGCQVREDQAPGSSTPVVPVNDPVPGDPSVPAPTEVTSVAIEEATFNFGEVAMGDKAVHRFILKNTGDKPLVIEGVKPACGCTAAEYTHEPIAPGESGFVETSMEAKTVGIFKKSVALTLNTEPRNYQLEFSGEVVE